LSKHQSSFPAARACAVAAVFIAILAAPDVAEAGKQNCKARRWRADCPVAAPAPSNGAPTISGTPPATAVTGQSYAFTPVAADPEGATLTFAIVNRPAWATFSASTGRLAGTPSSSAVGEYQDIRITVSDGVNQASLAPFGVTVLQSNRAPVISGSPTASVLEGQAYAFRPAAADADGDALTFSISNRPAWASFNAATGALTGTPGPGTAGSYTGIAIRVSDGTATATLPSFSIGVLQAANGSATLSWQPPTTRTDGSPLTNLAGFRIRYGTAVGSYPNVIDIRNAGLTSAVIGNLVPATWYFVISAYDAAGSESANSSPVSKTIT
jgi:hypothetical protein